MKLKRRQNPEPDVDMTPMIDMVFLLLVFFMCAASMSKVDFIPEIALPIAGLMSEEPIEEVAARAEELHRGLRACGCTASDAFMTFSLLALPVIPRLRLTDRGLVDVEQFGIVPLFAEEDNRAE